MSQPFPDSSKGGTFSSTLPRNYLCLSHFTRTEPSILEKALEISSSLILSFGLPLSLIFHTSLKYPACLCKLIKHFECFVSVKVILRKTPGISPPGGKKGEFLKAFMKRKPRDARSVILRIQGRQFVNSQILPFPSISGRNRHITCFSQPIPKSIAKKAAAFSLLSL